MKKKLYRIFEVEANPCIYDKADLLYSDRNKKEQVWQNNGLIPIEMTLIINCCFVKKTNSPSTFQNLFKGYTRNVFFLNFVDQ